MKEYGISFLGTDEVVYIDCINLDESHVNSNILIADGVVLKFPTDIDLVLELPPKV